MTLSVDWTRTDDRLVVTVNGEIDAGTAERVNDEFSRARQGDERSVVLDLTGVGFLDSAGLAAVVEIASVCHKADQSFTVAATTRAVLHPLKLTGLDRILNVSGEVPELSRR